MTFNPQAVLVGDIKPSGRTANHANWLLCDGAAVSRTTYAALFATVGVTFGAGDGSTTFNVPDLRGRFPLGKAGAGTGSTLGGTGGLIDHVHSVNPPDTTTGAPSDTVDATLTGSPVASATHTHQVDIAAFDSAAANPPFQVVNYFIAY